MSADNITHCPACGDPSLREWCDMGMSKSGILSIEYTCECRSCNFAYKFSGSVVAHHPRKAKSGQNSSKWPEIDL